MMTTSMLLLRNLSTPTTFAPASAEADASALANERPPTGYAIALLADGRFLPLAVAPTAEQETLAFALRPCSQHDDPVPLAEGDCPASGSGPVLCLTYQEALWWCQRRAETAHLLRAIQAATLRSECYPERNVWYREETERLLRQAGYDWPAWPESADGDEDEKKRETESKGPCCIVEALDGCPRLLAWLDMTPVGDKGDGGALPNVQVEAANLDELWERLYEAVSRSIPHRRAGTQESRG
jgi:hypothetical protein